MLRECIQRRAAHIFLALSFLSGFLELGSVVLLISAGQPLFVILLAGLSYQVGNLFSSTARLSRGVIIVTLFLAVLTTLLYSYTGYLILFFATLVLTSILLQKTRRVAKRADTSQSISTFTKRTIRIAGFVLAGFATVDLFIATILATLLLCVIMLAQTYRVWADPARPIPTRSLIGGIMVAHQSHYFSYAYLMPFLFARILGFSAAAIGPAFVVGWISYASSERLLRRYEPTRTSILGHLLVAISLSAIGVFLISPFAVLLFWFLSGIGGGTVFCLKKLNSSAGEKRTDMDYWEDVGHVAGVIIALTGVVMWGEALSLSFFLAASIALSVAGLLWLNRDAFPSELQKSN